MAFIADLTPYNYGREAPRPDVLAVGWLSKDEPFTQGDVPPAFTERLAGLIWHPVNLYRGSHQCEFCPPATPGRVKDARGNGEIRVQGDSGVVYVAPVLVAHYVTAHGYQPPQVFVDAVLRDERPDPPKAAR